MNKNYIIALIIAIVVIATGAFIALNGQNESENINNEKNDSEIKISEDEAIEIFNEGLNNGTKMRLAILFLPMTLDGEIDYDQLGNLKVITVFLEYFEGNKTYVMEVSDGIHIGYAYVDANTGTLL